MASVRSSCERRNAVPAGIFFALQLLRAGLMMVVVFFPGRVQVVMLMIFVEGWRRMNVMMLFWTVS